VLGNRRDGRCHGATAQFKKAGRPFALSPRLRRGAKSAGQNHRNSNGGDLCRSFDPSIHILTFLVVLLSNEIRRFMNYYPAPVAEYSTRIAENWTFLARRTARNDDLRGPKRLLNPTGRRRNSKTAMISVDALGASRSSAVVLLSNTSFPRALQMKRFAIHEGK